MKPILVLLRCLFLILSLALTWDWGKVAWAQTAHLPAGQENAVIQLLHPYPLGGEVTPGYKLWTISIQPSSITIGIQGANGSESQFQLIHPKDANTKHDKPLSTNFAIRQTREYDAQVTEALIKLQQAIEKNDQLSLWVITEPDSNPGTSSRGWRRPAAGSLHSLGDFDGMVILLFITFVGITLAYKLLRKSPRWMRLTLVVIIIMGMFIRLGISPVSFLGAWPWARLAANVRNVAEGPFLHWIATKLGRGFYLTDVISWTNFAYASLMPLILFSHATYLLRDPKAGLFAAYAVAFLPQHIRFSRAEDAFIPSLLLTSTAFALIHCWLRDRSTPFRFFALAMLPFVLYVGYLLRPLNMLFVIVYMAAIILLHPHVTTLARKWTAVAVVLTLWLFVLPVFVQMNTEPLSEAIYVHTWIFRSVSAFLIPKMFVLTDLQITPLVFLLLASIGIFLAFRRIKTRITVFLVGWLCLFTIAHAYVMEPEMRPRYHMHLVVPFILLGAIAASWMYRRYRGTVYILIAFGALSPLIHYGFITDVSYTEMQEHAFVLRAREQIPEGCTVLEYFNEENRTHSLRFGRIATIVGDDSRHSKFRELHVDKLKSNLVEDYLESTIKPNPPECLYFYQGLECWYAKKPEENIPQVCERIRGELKAEIIETQTVPLKLYDLANTIPSTNGMDQITFYLAKVPQPHKNQ